MLSSMQFDPRLIWDNVEGADHMEHAKRARRAQKTDPTRDAAVVTGARGVTGAQDATGSIQQSQDPKHD